MKKECTQTLVLWKPLHCLYFILMQRVLHILSEKLHFYISENITSYTFLLAFEIVKIRQCALTLFTGKNCFIQFSTRMVGWLLLTFQKCLHNQLSSIKHCMTRLRVQMFKNVISQIDNKNEWLLLPASFTAKLGWFLS